MHADLDTRWSPAYEAKGEPDPGAPLRGRRLDRHLAVRIESPGVKKKPTKGGLYQGYFTDYTGKKRYFTTLTRSEAKREAKRLEAEHRLIRQGIRPVPSSAGRHRSTLFTEAVDEYLDWGKSQGGRKGRPWSLKHVGNRTSQLAWWRESLGIEVLGDLTGVLGRVEKQLRELQALGRTGKTVSNYADTLGAFCDWCVRRGYLETDRSMVWPLSTQPPKYAGGR